MSAIPQRKEATGSPYQTLVHVDSETAIEICSNEFGFTINKFRDGEGWVELHEDAYAEQKQSEAKNGE